MKEGESFGLGKSERETNEKAFKMSTRPQNIVCKMVQKGVQCVCGCLYVCVCVCVCVRVGSTDRRLLRLHKVDQARGSRLRLWPGLKLKCLTTKRPLESGQLV